VNANIKRILNYRYNQYETVEPGLTDEEDYMGGEDMNFNREL